MDTRKLLEELENVINNASEVPLTNKKLVDKDEIERLIDAINQSLPNELESARRIVADKERIMAPFYDIELDTGIIISTLIMPRKEWENRPFLTPFQYNVNTEGIML